MAQSIKCPNVDFSSGHDLMVHASEPHVGLCSDSSEPGACSGFCVSLSPFLCLLLSLSLSLSLSPSLSPKNKQTYKTTQRGKRKQEKLCSPNIEDVPIITTHLSVEAHSQASVTCHMSQSQLSSGTEIHSSTFAYEAPSLCKHSSGNHVHRPECAFLANDAGKEILKRQPQHQLDV